MLVVRNTGDVFSNGIHLNVIHAAPSPAWEAWRNINAIDDVCREIITCTSQLVVTAIGGNAGAGGVILALGADRVIARDTWCSTRTTRRWACTARSTGPTCCPAASVTSKRPGSPSNACPSAPPTPTASASSTSWCPAPATTSTTPCWTTPPSSPPAADYPQLLEQKQAARAAAEARKPLDAYRVEELAEMSRDIFDDRHHFADARRAFVTKEKPTTTPTTSPPTERSPPPSTNRPRRSVRELIGTVGVRVGIPR